MCVLNDRKGGMITLLSLIFMLLATVWIGAMFSVSSLKKKYSEGLGKAEQATFLAEKGIALAYVELKYHGFDWATHKKDANGMLNKNPEVASTDSLIHHLYVKGAEWDDNGDYLPTGDSHLRVRTYQDDTLNTWIVARAEVDGVVRVARMRLESGQLYDYFMFVPGNLRLEGNNYFDGRGVGKIYVDGDVMWYSNNTVFKDILEFSTGSNGHLKVWGIWKKWAPYRLDTLYDQDLDGYALLSAKDGEFGYKAQYYPADDPKEAFYDPNGGVCSPGYVFRKPQDPSYWKGRRPPVFVFTKEKMGEKVGNWDPDETEVKVQVPLALYDDAGEPIKRDFDLYTYYDEDGLPVKDYGTNHELPVKFVRFYYMDKHGKWKITSDPSNHKDKFVVAQVFDGKDTAKETPYINYKIHGEIYHIPVWEHGIKYEYNGGSKTFDVEYEKEWWGDKYLNDPRQYIQNGYTRKDADPSWKGWPEHTWTNILDTSAASHLERFKDWVEGNYHYTENYDGYENEDHGLDLSNVIKIGGLDAKTQDPPEINLTFDSAAKTKGIWVGYEGDKFVVYVKGEKVYVDDGTTPPPDWLKSEEFYTGNDKFHKNGIKAEILTVDVKKMTEELGERLNESNGVVWINYRNPEEDTDHNYKKAIRLVNGEVLPRDLTIVTPQSVMIQGDFNCKDNDGNPDDSEWKPASIITDGDVYVLSEHFTPPTEAPAYKVPRFPNDDGVSGFGNSWSYKVNMTRRWRNYFLEKLDSDSLPSPSDDNKTKKEKEKKLKEAIKEFYDSLPDSERKYGGVDVDKIEFNKDEDHWANWEYMVQDIVSGFYKTHNPDHPSIGYAPAMPVIKDDDDKHIYIYASVVRSPAGNKDTGTRVYYLENWKWGDSFGWGSYDDPPSDVEVVFQGMFPRVRSSDEEIAKKNHWSDDYSGYVFASGAKWSGAFVEAWLNGCPNPKYYAQDYNNNYPPGSALVAAVKAYYISSNPSDFDRHPEGT